MWGWGGGKAKEAVASSSDGGFAPAAAAGRPDGAGLATAVATAAEEGRRPQHTHHEHIDDAPMTPVVYIVLWTSVAVGCLRGYALNSTIAARVAPSYTYTFSGHHQAELLRKDSPYCTTGVDGLPGVSWYESFIFIAPPAIAPLLGAVYVRRFGRRSGIMLGCVIIIIGQVLLSASYSLVPLYIGRALVQAASDVLFLSVAMQDIEIAPRTSRGFFLLVHVLGYAFGCCAVAVVGYFVATQSSLGWRLLFAMGTLPALAVLAVTPWLYETPHSSIERGMYAQGWEALREIRGPFYEDTYAEFMSIVRAAAAAPQGFRMYSELFRRRIYRPAIFLGVTICAVAALMDPLSRSYVAYQTLTRSGFNFGSAVLMSMLSLYGAYSVGALAAVVLVDRVGRVPLLKASGAVAVIIVSALVAMAVMYAYELHRAVTDSALPVPPKWPLWQLATLSILAGGNGVAWSSTVFVIVFESQSLAIRPAGMAVCIAMTNLAQSVLESRLLCLLRTMYYALVLAFSLIALGIAFFFVPETGRVSLEDISALYAKHWFWGPIMRPKKKKPKKQKRGRASKDAPGKHQQATPPKPQPSSSSGGDETGPSGLTTRTGSLQNDDVAARADTSHHAAEGADKRSPFERSSLQGAATGSDPPGVGQAPAAAEEEPASSAAAAEAAAAASIALAGASRAASSAASSLQHGRSVRKSLRLAGKRKSSHMPDVMSSDAVDRLAEELMDDE